MQEENRLTTLDVAIMLTLLGEAIAKDSYYERVNPIVVEQKDYVKRTTVLEEIRRKMKAFIPGEFLLEFLKNNAHLSELWPDIKLEDEIAKQLEDDSNVWAEVQGK
jgi:hypothetical protein